MYKVYPYKFVTARLKREHSGVYPRQAPNFMRTSAENLSSPARRSLDDGGTVRLQIQMTQA
jgi:hypothetical protein